MRNDDSMIDDDDDSGEWEETWSPADDGDDEGETIPCPYCGEPYYEDSPRCPACGKYVSREDVASAGKPWWIIVTVVLLLLAWLIGVAAF